ncbi:IS3 family transposase, partial ['Santalum album' aster yellows phytoplasma]
MQKLKKKIKLLQNMVSHIQTINKKIVFNLIKKFENDLNLTTILKVIRINRSTYYYWLKIEKKLKFKETKYFLQQQRIQTLCLQNEYFYGHRKITDLYQEIFNEFITKKKVYLIMKENNICCKLRPKKNKYYYKNLKSNLQVVPNLINQNFTTSQPMQ